MILDKSVKACDHTEEMIKERVNFMACAMVGLAIVMTFKFKTHI